MSQSEQSKTPRAGGFFIALLSMVGVFAGGFMGQPVIGLLAGIGLGVLISLAIWLKERNG